jgi:hypothetical protein
MHDGADAATGSRPLAERTTISPQPEIDPTETPGRRAARRSMRNQQVQQRPATALAQAEPPYPGARILRLALSGMLFGLSLLTLGGAVLVLLLWQQDRDAGVLTTQVDRVWGLFGDLASIERLLAFALVPVVLAWSVLATFNVRRATGQRRSPAVPAIALALAIGGVWYLGAELVVPAEDWIGRAVGYVLQAIAIVLPLIAFERIAEVAEARRRPMHVTVILAIVFVIALQELGGLSTVAATDDSSEWGMLGVRLVILALIQALGALAANEAARAIEDGTQHRYGLRSRFGESVLHQAGLA